MTKDLGIWLTFLLIAARLLSFFVAAPIFGRRNIPPLAKIGLAITLSLVVFTAVKAPYEGSVAQFVMALGAEVVSGLAAGMLAGWLLQSFQMGGQVMDQQAGFGTAALFDPGSATQSSLMANFVMHLSILVFLELNGHHLLVLGIVRSFAVVGPGEVVLGRGVAELALRTLFAASILLVRVAVPVVVVLMITDLTLGMVGRTVPQLNVLMLGLPIKAAVALLVLGIISPVFLGIGHNVLSAIESTFGSMLGLMTP